jgi:hypothetical protein
MNQKDPKMHNSDFEQAQIDEIEAGIQEALARGDRAELLEIVELFETEAAKLRAVFG